jgi:GNAT superfamily N-acetyltransferase
MSGCFNISRATCRDAADLSILVGELLGEIVAATGADVFGFELEETTARLTDFIRRDKYFVFFARTHQGQPAGFITLYEGYAVYARGVFGTIAELYVRPEHRSRGLGLALITDARALATSAVGAGSRSRHRRYPNSREPSHSTSVRDLR